MTVNWTKDFPSLELLGDEVAAQLQATARLVTLPAGAKAFEAGGACEHYLLVARGTVRVQQIAESGREIVLYRVGGGETCVLTTAGLLAHQPYAAEGIAETEVEAAMLPRPVFNGLLGQSSVFRDFVFSSYATRLTDLLLLVEEVAFRRIDVRLAERLLDRRDAADLVSMTHHDLAVELGSVREVVSRQLKEFERRGWVTLERGSISVTDINSLEKLVQES